MKQIKIRSVITNGENETTNVETMASFNELDNTITYEEEDLTVIVTIESDNIKLRRFNDDYNLNLEFRLNQKIVRKYEVKSIGLDIDLTVHTKKLEIKERYVYIEYQLYNEENNMGVFEYKLMFLGG